MPLIRTEKLTKTVPQGHGRLWLLRDVDMHVDEGEFVSIMGPSGAGKTTLLHILGMHDADWEGSFTIDGTKIESLSAKHRADLQRRTVGFVFQSYHLIDDLTVAENLDVPLRYRDVPKRERESIVADVLDRFRIVAKKDLYPSQLSGGQQQLVGIARAIVSNPRVILADEPTGNLHSDQAREIMELFRTLHRGGTTIVQVTHSEENAAYGDRVVRLHDGRVVR
ncbi:MAG: phosphonate ABC transporter ATP-binding protein [Acidobacteria bacterium]|nr:MAG: phosphonate ABC transporter ATP-binding protein [Acidobacteriota bacterium]